MRPPRLSPRALAEHLIFEPPEVARLVRALRATILKTVPDAAEAIKFGALCFYHADAFFGSIGGNICMIEIKDGPRRRGQAPDRRVFLSFIHGAGLPDPHGLLRGRLKAKRLLPITDVSAVKDPRTVHLVRAARDLRPWD